MPQLAEPMPNPQYPAPHRIRWTRAQCDAMEEIGLLTGRYELIDGEILSTMGQNPPHRAAVVLLYAWLSALFGALFVQTQSTIDVSEADPDHNQPEPDAAVTILPNPEYTDRHPGPDDLVLVAEVSDSTLQFDRTTKAALYALAGIREYWIIDIVGRRVFVHREPTSERYLEITTYGAEEMVATLALPTQAVRVAELLPRRSVTG
jgi:Uma2 family endonuclease